MRPNYLPPGLVGRCLVPPNPAYREDPMLIGCLITAGTCEPFQVALADAGHVVMMRSPVVAPHTSNRTLNRANGKDLYRRRWGPLLLRAQWRPDMRMHCYNYRGGARTCVILPCSLLLFSTFYCYTRNIHL